MTSQLAGILKRMAQETGLRYQRRDFQGRIRIQKTIYLLKALGYRKVQRFQFNLYIRGPYSPRLARAYYDLSARDLSRARSAWIPEEILEPATDAILGGIPFLEVLTTLHLIGERDWRRGKEELLDHVRWIKEGWPPNKLDRYLEGAWAFLEEYGLLPEHT